MIHPLYELLSDKDWEAAWPSSGPRVEGKSAVKRAKEFGIDMTLVIESLNLSPTQRLQRAQKAAASLLKLQRAALNARPVRSSRK